MLRRPGRIVIIGILVILSLLYVLRYHHGHRDHYLHPDGLIQRDGAGATNEVSVVSDWRKICRQHGFSTFGQHRKVYDLVLFSTELDWLEIRLRSHGPYVDYFVVIESPTTFTMQPKPLILKENWDRFKDFHHKIIYKTVEDPVSSANLWDHEDFFRNALLREVFPSLEGTKAAHEHDVLIVSDMDELLKPGALLLMRYCDFPQRLTLRSHFYYYSFQWLHRGEQWPHPQATTFGTSLESTLAPNDLRMNLLGQGISAFASLRRWWNTATLWNAGWHCSSCFSTVKEMQTKMQSFSHQSWNTASNRDANTMVERVRKGLDLFARPDQMYDKVEDNRDVPQYILDEHAREGKFKYLLNRDGEDAGFEDWAQSRSGSA